MKCREEEDVVSILDVNTIMQSNREFRSILLQHFPIDVVH